MNLFEKEQTVPGFHRTVRSDLRVLGASCGLYIMTYSSILLYHYAVNLSGCQPRLC